MKHFATIAAIVLITICTAAQDQYKFANHGISCSQLVNEWHDQNLYTAAHEAKPDIVLYMLSFAQAYPTDITNSIVAEAMGFENLGVFTTVDKGNGYIRGELQTELTTTLQMCYWRCNDGILIAVAIQGDEYTDERECDSDHDSDSEKDNGDCECRGDDGITVNINDLMFFKILSDEALWRPITPQALCGRTFDFSNYEIVLPQEGKDIELRATTKGPASYRLTFNGTAFTTTPL